MKKSQVYKPKTIKEAVDILEEFLECDLYSKFRPEEIIDGKVWRRTDIIKTEKDFSEYLKCHFDILRKEIKRLQNKKKVKVE